MYSVVNFLYLNEARLTEAVKTMFVLGEKICWRDAHGIGLEQADVLEAGTVKVTASRFEAGGIELMHRHDGVQVGYVVTGRFQVIIAGEGKHLGEGDFYCIPAGAEHGIRALTAGMIVETLSDPIRLPGE